MSWIYEHFSRIFKRFSNLSLRWKIYLSLAAILFPVFSLIIIVQTQFTRPLLEEEVREVGLSVCRSLSSDIIAFHLLTQPDQLEARLIETSWMQASVVRIDVIQKDEKGYKLIATNIAEANPNDFDTLNYSETPVTVLKQEENRDYWDILYPIKSKNQHRVLGYIHTEVSLQLVNHVVGIFSKLAVLGAFLTISLLIGILSYYLRRTIENERKLRVAESTNIELTQQLHEIQRQLFLNEKLAILGQVTASFAHEIGTPLNSLSGHLQLLHEEVKQPHAQERIGIINSQVSRIEGIVKNFLASTHAPSQQRQLVDISSLIQRITKLVAPRLQTLKARLAIEVDSRLEAIRVVPTDIEQILLNLTNNAMDALEASKNPNRQLTYLAKCNNEKDKKTLCISLHDTGDGIDQTTLKQVLKPFFTTKAPGQGTGLGLTISQRLAKKYGGRIEIYSALGKGTTVTVNIPYDPT